MKKVLILATLCFATVPPHNIQAFVTGPMENLLSTEPVMSDETLSQRILNLATRRAEGLCAHITSTSTSPEECIEKAKKYIKEYTENLPTELLRYIRDKNRIIISKLEDFIEEQQALFEDKEMPIAE